MSSAEIASTVSSSALPAPSSQSNGCVTCTDSVSCPQCAADEYCAVTVQTCAQCPQTYCAKRTSTLSSSSNSSSNGSSQSHGGHGASASKVGGIVGGVVGGTAFLIAILLVYLYVKYWSKNKAHNRNVLVAEGRHDEDLLDDPESGGYEKNGHLQGPGGPAGPTGLHRPGNRSSAATVTTRASSNILPIAYIPGVTAGKQGKLPPLPRHLLRSGDTRSHITLGSSILGGMDDDDDSTSDDRDRDVKTTANGRLESDADAGAGEKNDTNHLTTAIRAKPKLVQISEEEEDDDDDDGDDENTGPLIDPLVPSLSNEKTLHYTRELRDSSTPEDHTREMSDAAAASDSDDGSFILDVAVADTVRDQMAQRYHVTTSFSSEQDPHATEGSGSPFEDKFRI
ncbi:LAMI_0D09076g1_1 [Lachancea mirantina]|uniref:LAMI_0D09076g1_1 n=1 Tax=Lachancea mirantina TaxID=1230905 RepID=A0A1G4JDY8_9SACH|nr:LAMI_0D09076g1_1 [Lachancea mirantina]